MCANGHRKSEDDARALNQLSVAKKTNSSFSLRSNTGSQVMCEVKSCFASQPFYCRSARPSTSSPATIIVFVLISIYLFPLLSTQALAAEDDFLPAVGAFSSDVAGGASTGFATKTVSDPVISVPRLQALRKPRNHKKKSRSKCPKKFRKTYCLNKGRCRWIQDISQPSCRCKKGWRGERCEEPWIEFTEKDKNQDIVTLVVVLSSFGLVGVVMTTCICWRRLRSIRNELEDEENQEVMLTQQQTTKQINNIPGQISQA